MRGVKLLPPTPTLGLASFILREKVKFEEPQVEELIMCEFTVSNKVLTSITINFFIYSFGEIYHFEQYNWLFTSLFPKI